MADMTNPSELRGKKVVDPGGADIGEAKEIYLDHGTDRPAFALVKTGLLGSKHTFVPLTGGSLDGPRIWVQVDKAQVRDAPKIDPDEEISRQQQEEVYRHYGIESSDTTSTATASGSTQEEGDSTSAASGSTQQQEGDSTSAASGTTQQGGGTREAGTPRAKAPEEAGSREPEPSGTQPRAAGAGAGDVAQARGGTEEGLPRLRRYVVTEEVEVTVPVQREEVRVEPSQQTDETRPPGPGQGQEPPAEPPQRRRSDETSQAHPEQDQSHPEQDQEARGAPRERDDRAGR